MRILFALLAVLCALRVAMESVVERDTSGAVLMASATVLLLTASIFWKHDTRKENGR